MTPLAKAPKRQVSPSEILAKNIRFFYERDWKQNEKQGKTVYNATTTAYSPTMGTVELVAGRAKVPPWYLLLPLDEDLLQGPELADLVYTFISLNPADRKWVLDTIHRAK